MSKLADLGFKALEVVMVLLLVGMVGMVLMMFGNVILRYAFNSGITISEELSRFFFVWLTFIGAIVAIASTRTWASTRW